MVEIKYLGFGVEIMLALTGTAYKAVANIDREILKRKQEKSESYTR